MSNVVYHKKYGGNPHVVDSKTNETDSRVTGQMFFRDSGAKDSQGRTIMAVTGLLAIPANCSIVGEHRYTISGKVHPDATGIAVLHRSKDNLTELAAGQSLNGLLRKPIWQV